MSAGSVPLPPSLLEALHQSRDWGFLGDGPIDVHIAHAPGFVAALTWATDREAVPRDEEQDVEPRTGAWMDLGSGGGIPGLVLAHAWPERQAVLLDSSERRTRFLSQVVEDQGWTDRVRVMTVRAEDAGRSESLRGTYSLVVARSFGSPPLTAECAAPFLGRGGLLIVSEPPTDSRPVEMSDPSRWPDEGIGLVGLTNLGLWRHAFGYRVLRQSQRCPERFPRRVGVPAKRPLYRVP